MKAHGIKDVGRAQRSGSDARALKKGSEKVYTDFDYPNIILMQDSFTLSETGEPLRLALNQQLFVFGISKH